MLFDCLLHVHSSYSYDSKSPIEQIARVASQHGIRCVLMSEHNNFLDPDRMAALVDDCERLSNESLLMVPGLELAYDGNRVHLLAFGIREFIDSAAPGVTFRSLVDAVHRQGGLAVLAHPSHKDAAARLARADLEALDGVEVWNVKNGNRFFPRVRDLALLRDLRASEKRLVGLGGLDWHHLDKFARIVVRVEAESLTRDAVLASLRSGKFHIRCGAFTIPSHGDVGPVRTRLYGAGGAMFEATRRTGYRMQRRLERSGRKTPRVIAAVAKRLF